MLAADRDRLDPRGRGRLLKLRGGPITAGQGQDRGRRQADAAEGVQSNADSPGHGPILLQIFQSFISPLPCTRGRGGLHLPSPLYSGERGATSPLSPEYKGEGRPSAV